MVLVMDGPRERLRRLRQSGGGTSVALPTRHGETADRAASIDRGAADDASTSSDPGEQPSRVLR